MNTSTNRFSQLTQPALIMSSVHRALVQTDANPVPAITRIVLGGVILPHGAQKLLGWFGGYGFDGTMSYFTDTLHIPWILALGVIITEVAGGFALLAGFATRIAAAGVAIVLATAAVMVHAPHGFFMNWFGNQQGEGVEFFILALAIAGLVIWHGVGAFSVDWLLTRGGDRQRGGR
ncbi:MAG TPA: DoxX family protein [Opitutaceae bacterium]